MPLFHASSLTKSSNGYCVFSITQGMAFPSFLDSKLRMIHGPIQIGSFLHSRHRLFSKASDENNLDISRSFNVKVPSVFQFADRFVITIILSCTFKDSSIIVYSVLS